MENHISYLKNGQHCLRNIWIDEENRWVNINSNEVLILCGEQFGMYTMTFECECCDNCGKIYYFFSLQQNDYILHLMNPVAHHVEDELVIFLPDGTLGNFTLKSRKFNNDTQILKCLCDHENFEASGMITNQLNLECFFKFVRNGVIKKGCFKYWKLCVSRSQTKQNRKKLLCFNCAPTPCK